jgi:hypothetical protein
MTGTMDILHNKIKAIERRKINENHLLLYRSQNLDQWVDGGRWERGKREKKA